jgi:hypothetical protein
LQFRFKGFWRNEIGTSGQFHQDFTDSFFVLKLCAKLFCTYILGLYFFGKRISAEKLLVKCWWNWHKVNVERGEKQSISRLTMSHLKYVFLFLILGQVLASFAFILEISNRDIIKMFKTRVNRIEAYKCWLSFDFQTVSDPGLILIKKTSNLILKHKCF